MDKIEIVLLVSPVQLKVVDEKLKVVRDPGGLDGAQVISNYSCRGILSAKESR